MRVSQSDHDKEHLVKYSFENIDLSHPLSYFASKDVLFDVNKTLFYRFDEKCRYCIFIQQKSNMMFHRI